MKLLDDDKKNYKNCAPKAAKCKSDSMPTMSVNKIK